MSGSSKSKKKKLKQNVSRSGSRADQLGQVSSDEYMVENIEDKRLEPDGTWRYFIKWMGWPRETNTWEPIEHLNECEELLRAFEEKWAKKIPNGVGAAASPLTNGCTTKTPGKTKRSDSDESSNYDSEEDEQLSKLKTKAFLECGVLEDCPPNKEPKAMIGVISLNGVLNYLVEWKKNEEEEGQGAADIEPQTDQSLILSTPFKVKYPGLVIAFYEKHIHLTGGDEDETEVVAESAGLALAEARGKKSVGDDDNDNESDGDELIPKMENFNTNDLDLDSSSESSDSEDEYFVDKDP